MIKLPDRRATTIFIAASLIALTTIGAWRWRRATTPKRFMTVERGKLYRSRQPKGTRYGVLDTYDIKRVISLHNYTKMSEVRDEEIRECDARGIDFVQINVVELLPTVEQTRLFIQQVRSADGAVLFHCEHGRDRTGFMSAAYRIVMQDWGVQEAIDEIGSFGAKVDGHKGELIRQQLEDIEANRAQWQADTAPPSAQLASP